MQGARGIFVDGLPYVDYRESGFLLSTACATPGATTYVSSAICWALTVASSIRAAYSREGVELPPLSVQEIVDGARGPPHKRNPGCGFQ
ncbi:hypothetical protein CRG98_019930 [Punica granatum]|uniref:Uncharacterized protein n=1 Tax=Punica granatum TaxID=22663 RepID=A0A2I0JTP3_PUNGR|nr:hypothetical protein CRG98_019930 [Punica granatum]